MKKWQLSLISAVLFVSAPAVAWRPALCEPSPGASSLVQDAWIEDEYLWVKVRWASDGFLPATMPPFEAKIQVLDRDENAVVDLDIAIEPGRIVSYQVTEAPTFFAENGFWYEIRIVDHLGEVLATEFPVLVSFCPAGSGCSYSVVDGIGTDAVAMSTELFELLEELEAGGVDDLLGEALARRPDLAFEIYWVAEQLFRLFGEPANPPCVCFWTTAFSADPETQLDSAQEGDNSLDLPNPDWELRSYLGPGANGYFAAQMLAGTKHMRSLTGRAQGGLHLRCRTIDDWETVSWEGRVVHIPSFSPCQRDCGDASIEVDAGAKSQVFANAWSTLLDAARGRAFAAASFFLDEELVPDATATAGVEVNRPPGSVAQEMLEDSPVATFGQWTLAGGDATAAFIAELFLELCLADAGPITGCDGSFPRPESDRGPWAFGCAATASRATLVGQASCAREQRAAVSLWQIDFSHTENGLLIVPWNP